MPALARRIEFSYSSKKQDSLEQSKQEETGLPHTVAKDREHANQLQEVLEFFKEL